MKKKLIIVTIILALLAALLGLSTSFASRLALFELFLSLTPTAPLLSETNVLILGIDDAFGHRSDTIMVLHVNPEKKEASVISIPRDTIVTIPERGLDKVNHAFAYGGIDLARRTVENLLRVNIPYHLVVDLAGIENLIDQIGGVSIDVEKRMYYIDYAGGLFIDLKPGPQKLSGKQLTGYLRFRHIDNDFARIGRQQNFLRAIAAELMKRENLLRSPTIFFSLLSCLNTNINSREILALSLTLRSAFELNSVRMNMIPGEGLVLDGIYYWKPDLEGVQKMVGPFISGRATSLAGSLR
jgi:LCP family protein required for cell wall assembly